MILSQLAIIAPDLTTKAFLGKVSFDGQGSFTGYTLDTLDISPAPLVVRRQKMPTFAGGIVASGHPDIRDVKITGTIIGSSIDNANQLWQQLSQICGDPLTDVIHLQFVPFPAYQSTLTLELQGVVQSLKPTPMGGFQIGYEIAFVAGQPFASNVVPTTWDPSQSSGPTSNGNVLSYPSIELATTGAVSALNLSIAHEDGSVDYFNLTGLSLTDSGTISITTRPGFEDVQVQQGSAAPVRAIKSRQAGSTWPTIKPGNNTVTLTTTGGSAVVTSITWNDGYTL